MIDRNEYARWIEKYIFGTVGLQIVDGCYSAIAEESVQIVAGEFP